MTAKKLPSVKLVSYMITGDSKYLIMTNDAHVVGVLESMGHQMRYENHSYHLLVDELPMSEFLEYRLYKVKPISESNISTLEVELQRLKDIEAAMEQMNDTYEKQLKVLERMVKSKGLHLKPHLPKDSEMFSPKHKERVHFKTSLQQIIDQEVVEKLVGKFPQLKKCFRKKVSIFFDRAMYNKIQKTLPASAINQICSYNEVESLNFYELEEWECRNCGGKFTKKGICKHCGLTKG